MPHSCTLTGTYVLHLEWKDASLNDIPNPEISDRPSIFTAVTEQLGLKLESAKGPVEVIVTDRSPPRARTRSNSEASSLDKVVCSVLVRGLSAVASSGLDSGLSVHETPLCLRMLSARATWT